MADRRGTGAPPDWRTRLVLELQRDKKKTAIMMALGLVAAVMAGRLIVGRLGPAKASASQQIVATAQIAMPTSLDGMAGDAAHEQANRRDEYINRITPGITRDLFHYSPETFPLTDREKVEVGIPKGATPKPVDDKAIQKKVNELLRARARSLAGGLKLQSTIIGSSPMAIINGRLLRIGQKIADFTVMSVTNRKCTLETEIAYVLDDETYEIEFVVTAKEGKPKAKPTADTADNGKNPERKIIKKRVPVTLQMKDWKGRSGGGT